MEAEVNFYPEFNFPDGDIILAVTANDPRADDTPEPVYLKVHKNILRLHSETFDEMLGVPLTHVNASYGSLVIPGLVNGVPVIPLQDEPHDVANLMQAIYFG